MEPDFRDANRRLSIFVGPEIIVQLSFLCWYLMYMGNMWKPVNFV